MYEVPLEQTRRSGSQSETRNSKYPTHARTHAPTPLSLSCTPNTHRVVEKHIHALPFHDNLVDGVWKREKGEMKSKEERRGKQKRIKNKNEKSKEMKWI